MTASQPQRHLLILIITSLKFTSGAWEETGKLPPTSGLLLLICTTSVVCVQVKPSTTCGCPCPWEQSKSSWHDAMLWYGEGWLHWITGNKMDVKVRQTRAPTKLCGLGWLSKCLQSSFSYKSLHVAHTFSVSVRTVQGSVWKCLTHCSEYQYYRLLHTSALKNTRNIELYT